MIVDTAREFLKIPAESIEPPPDALTGLSGRYLEGIATIDERPILVLNLDAVLDLDYEDGRQDDGSDARKLDQ
jgi:purine-binding chemotaxis protein CheW